MKAKTFGFVASLIAIVLSSFSGQAHAQTQPLWANAQTVTGVEFGTRDEAGNCQVLSNGQTSCRYYLSAKADEIAALDGYATRPGLQLKRTGETVVGFAPGTPGTVTMRKLMFCLGGRIVPDMTLPEAERSGAVRCQTANTVYSHVNVPDKIRDGNSENLVVNPKLAYFAQPFWAGYLEDQSNLGIAFVPPYSTVIGGKTFEFCPAGTREVRKWYNGSYERAAAVGSTRLNDGNWRFTSSFKWRDSALPAGYESSYDDELFCGPAEVAKVWVNNDYPTDIVFTSGQRDRGSFVSRFTLGSIPAIGNALVQNSRQDFVVDDTNRQNWFDNSRKTFVTPTASPFTIMTAKNGTPPSTTPVIGVVQLPQALRLGIYVHERSGRVYQLSDSFTQPNAVFVSPSGAIVDMNPKVLVRADADNTGLVQANVAGDIQGDLFFRVLSQDNWTKGSLEVYDLRQGEVGIKIATYAIPFALARSGALNDFRPRISLDAKRGELYILNTVVGRLFAVNFASGNTREIIIANRNGDAIMDVAVDAASDKLYVIAQPTLGNSGNADNRYTTPGRLLEQSMISGQALREVLTGNSPTAFTLGLTQSKLTAFVANVAGNTISEIDIATFARSRETPTQIQPLAIALEFKD